MASTPHLLICALVVSGCALQAEPEPPTLPVLPPVPVVSAGVVADAAPPDRVEIVAMDTQREPPPTPPRLGKALRPEAVIVQAQRAARIEPSERGYGGQRGEQVYAWAPGKVYTVYLSKKQGTGIFLPPGERLVSGLYLDPEAYEVQTKRAGVGEEAYDALTIRPTGDSGEVGAFLLTESGRRYLLHLVVGSVGMLAVTFEGPLVTQARTPAPALVLPRPPP
jgi:hypothetical protein